MSIRSNSSRLSPPITRRRSSMLYDFVPLKQSPFDELPNELVETILRFLDPESLKQSMLVNRRFNQVISQSAKIMSQLPLTVRVTRGTENHDIADFKRRYREINFKGFAANKWFKYIRIGLRKLGANVAKVNFRDCCFNENGISDVLSCFPNVEALSIVSISRITTATDNVRPLKHEMFPKLKKVQLELNASILKSLVALQLKCVEILCLEGEEWRDLTEFVTNQTKLKNLTLIDSCNIPEDLQLNVSLCPNLKIQTLNFLFLKNVIVTKFIEFLSLFIGSVKFLTIVRVERDLETHRIFEFVLKNFRDLQGLAIDFDHLPTNEQFYRDVEVNKNLNNLALNCRTLNNPIGFREIFRTFPSVSSLSISITNITDEMEPEDFLSILNLKNLQSFFLVLQSSADIRRFRNVTSLNIIAFQTTTVDWIDLGRCNPNLKMLIISKVLHSSVLNFKLLGKNLTNLEHLQIGEGFKITTTDLLIIKKNCKKLKVLKLLKSCWKMKETPAELLRMMKFDGIQIVLQSVTYENVAFYSNTFFFKSF